MNFVKPYLKQLDILFFYLSIFTLTQSIKLSSKFLFIALGLGILKSIYAKNFQWFRKQKKIIRIYGVFFVYIICQGILIDGYSTFFQYFVKDYAPYIIFLLIPIFYVDIEKVNYIPKVFIAGILFTFSLIVIKSIFQLEFYDRTQVLDEYGLHHLYISLYILFAINYLIANLSINKLNRRIIATVVLLLILGLFLMFFRSKAAIVISILLIGYYMFIKVKWTKIKIGLVLITFIGLIIVFKINFLDIYQNAIDFRSRIWDVALELIYEKPFYGGGANEHLLLNRRHFLLGNYDFLDSNLNTHNQYLTFLIKFGFMGLMLIILPFMIPLFKIKKQLRIEYIGFLVLVGLMAFIESIYNRHHGIVFCTVFLYYYNAKHQTNLET